MNYLKMFVMVYLLFFAGLNGFAQEIGMGWDFNTAGDTEGWQINRSLADVSVSDSTLDATVNGYNPALKGPDFSISAVDYGYVFIRIKANGVKTGKIYWDNDAGTSGSMQFVMAGDSLFHEYKIPVVNNEKWTSQITCFTKLSFTSAPGITFHIDYIRIVSMGERFNVEFKPLRTVFKTDDTVPLLAVITNSGDKLIENYKAVLSLPDEIDLTSGTSITTKNNLEINNVDSLMWTIACPVTGELEINLNVFSDSSDTTDVSINSDFTDLYWKQDSFIISAWSAPAQTTEDYDEYYAANFNTINRVNTDLSQVDFVKNYGMDCFLNIYSKIPGDFAARDNLVPDPIMDEDLSVLESVLNEFKDIDHIIGHHVVDEPNAKAFENLGKVVSYIRKRDPERVSFINLFPTYASNEQLGTSGYDEHVKQFMEIVKPEVLSYDHYNFFVTPPDGIDYFMNLEIIRKYALLYDVPFCIIIQAINSQVRPDVWRKLNKNEYRWLVYSSLAYGTRGITYFAWAGSYGIMTSPEKEEAYAAIQSLNAEIRALGPVLMNLTSTGTYHLSQVPLGCKILPDQCLLKSITPENPFMVGFFKDKEDQEYFMLMNRNYDEDKSLQVILNRNVESAAYFNVVTGQWQDIQIENSVEGSTFVFDFLPGGGTLFKVGQTTDVKNSTKTSIPLAFDLEQNYPNPFNPVTKINYSLSRAGHVNLTVYDLLGRQVAVLVDKNQKAGEFQLDWNAARFPSGVYIYRLKAGSKVQTRKMVLVK